MEACHRSNLMVNKSVNDIPWVGITLRRLMFASVGGCAGAMTGTCMDAVKLFPKLLKIDKVNKMLVLPSSVMDKDEMPIAGEILMSLLPVVDPRIAP